MLHSAQSTYRRGLQDTKTLVLRTSGYREDGKVVDGV